MLPRPDFVPAWIPDWAIVANSLLVEVALLVALYTLIVRRAERKRRALAVFAAAVLLLGGLEGLLGFDLLAKPRLRGSYVLSHLFFSFDWNETPVFGFCSKRQVFVSDGDVMGFYPDEAGFVVLRTGLIRDQNLLRVLWPYHDRPDDAETRAAIWRAFVGSNIARNDARLAPYVKGR